jgi:hypothetical protein
MTSLREALQNLAKVGKLKAEAPNQGEFNGLIRSAQRKLLDAQNPALSPDSRFILAYDAAHSFALASLRWHGFRSENRFIVFQVLDKTVSLPAAKWRVLDNCHHKRNLALYEGDCMEDELLILELITVTRELQTAVAELGPVVY